MCYSALLARSFGEYEKSFSARVDWDAFVRLYLQREIDLLLKIPSELDDMLMAHGGATALAIRNSVMRWRAACDLEMQRLDSEITHLNGTLPKKATSDQKTPLKDAKSRLKKIQTVMKAQAAADSTFRIYPKYFAPVIVDAGGEKVVVPMRYRILPRTGVEVPDEYNVFNARRSSLLSARNWKPLFGKKHAVFPFLKFFEWVSDPETGRKIEISFSPDGYARMWAASLYEEYENPAIGTIRSFAMVTDEPPPEVSAAGHDRCPVFLNHNLIDEWLRPAGKSSQQLDSLLDEKQPTFYSHAVAA
jgi:putative SOS response-associated peptidase YedK